MGLICSSNCLEAGILRKDSIKRDDLVFSLRAKSVFNEVCEDIFVFSQLERPQNGINKVWLIPHGAHCIISMA